jgi:hypothetical protein
LAKLADRILHTLANSVPCERNFSAINIIHNKLRNALTVKKVNKLLYIQINRKTLRRDPQFRDKDENKDEDEDEVVDDTGEDAIFISPAYTTEAEPREKAFIKGSEDDLV